MPIQRFGRPAIIAVVVGTLALAVVFAALSLASLRAGQARDDAANGTLHTVHVMYEAQSLLTALVDVETGLRGYALTDDPAFLQPYDAGRVAVARHWRALAAMTTDNPVQRASLAALRREIDAKLAFCAERIAEAKAGDFDRVREMIRSGEGKRSMDGIRARTSAILAEEDRSLAQRTQHEAHEIARSRQTVYAVVGVGVLIIIAAGIALALALRQSNQARETDLLRRVAEQVQSELEARVEERTQALRAADAQVRQMQKMEMVGQLTGGIAHDFNNMLAVVIGALDLANRRRDKEGADIGRFLDMAMEGARRAADLTHRLLAFARQQPLAPTIIDANALVRDISGLLERTLGDGFALRTFLADDLWSTRADQGQVENALVNLAVNARDAMGDSGRLTLETANVWLDDTYSAAHAEVTAGPYVMIAVSDTGCGMTDDIREKALEPFFTTKPPGRGTGLGLSQVFGFIKQSRGHMKIYSEIGHGTTVKLFLPRDDGALTAITGRPTGAIPRARESETVLVVEDDERVRAMSVAALQDLGYRVIAAASGTDALDIIAADGLPTLVFTDVVMPGMTGKLLADRILLHHPAARILFTTGYTRNAIVHNGTLDEGVAFLAKPFTIEQLALRVRETIDHTPTTPV